MLAMVTEYKMSLATRVKALLSTGGVMSSIFTVSAEEMTEIEVKW